MQAFSFHRVFNFAKDGRKGIAKSYGECAVSITKIVFLPILISPQIQRNGLFNKQSYGVFLALWRIFRGLLIFCFLLDFNYYLQKPWYFISPSLTGLDARKNRNCSTIPIPELSLDQQTLWIKANHFLPDIFFANIALQKK